MIIVYLFNNVIFFLFIFFFIFFLLVSEDEPTRVMKYQSVRGIFFSLSFCFSILFYYLLFIIALIFCATNKKKKTGNVSSTDKDYHCEREKKYLLIQKNQIKSLQNSHGAGYLYINIYLYTILMSITLLYHHKDSYL